MEPVESEALRNLKPFCLWIGDLLIKQFIGHFDTSAHHSNFLTLFSSGQQTLKWNFVCQSTKLASSEKANGDCNSLMSLPQTLLPLLTLFDTFFQRTKKKVSDLSEEFSPILLVAFFRIKMKVSPALSDVGKSKRIASRMSTLWKWNKGHLW